MEEKRETTRSPGEEQEPSGEVGLGPGGPEDQATPIVPLTEEEVKRSLDYHIENYLKWKARAAEAVEPFHRHMSTHKEEIGALLLQLREPKHTGETGQAYISTRMSVRYDAKALDALCKSFPEIEREITPHRTEKTSKSLTVK